MDNQEGEVEDMIVKIKKSFQEDGTLDKARLEEAPAIRDLLEDLIAQTQQSYNTAAADHRYLQGGLHLLCQLRDLIKQP